MVARSLLLAVALLFAAAPAAAAQQYPPTEAAIECTDTTVVPGQTISCRAKGFMPGTVVTFTLGGHVIGTDVANEDGVAVITFTIPSVADPGTYRLTASGVGFDGEPLSVSTTITVVAGDDDGGGGPPPVDEGELPVTGANSTVPLARVGIVAVVTGSLLVFAANKRRRVVRA